MWLPDTSDLLARLDLSTVEYAVQRIQTEFRRRLVEAWNIQPNAKVIEIGCGQGDMTLVLGAAVGPAGHVTAVDAETEVSGSPVTFGEAAARIRRSAYATPISFRFGTDILDPEVSLPLTRYDAAVLAHSSWYFTSPNHFGRTLKRLAELADRLYLSEWDLQPTKLSQVPHFLAALFQGRVATLVPGTEGNIRTLLSRSSIERIVEEAGWHIEEAESINSSDLQDGRWEMSSALALLEMVSGISSSDELHGVDFHAIAALTRRVDIESLPSFMVACRRQGSSRSSAKRRFA